MIALTLFELDDFIKELTNDFHPVIAVHTSYTHLNYSHRYDVFATAFSFEGIILRYQHAVIQELFEENARKKAKAAMDELKNKLKEKLDERFIIREGLWHDSADPLLRRL